MLVLLKSILIASIEVFVLFALILLALLSRLFTKKFTHGIGPLPLINNVYHKRALALFGWNAETFVTSLFHITSDFDVKLHERWKYLPAVVISWLATARAFFRYESLIFYFDGGPLARSKWLWRCEPLFYKWAGVKTLILGYGSDVQEMTRTPNLLFKHAMSVDYPYQPRKRELVSQRIDLWMSGGSHIMGGCEWVDYIPGWDSLAIAHFSIDTSAWAYKENIWRGPHTGPLRVLHAPNHRAIKGTSFLIKAIEELKAEKFNIELVLLENVPNHKIKEVMDSCHLVVDQLVIGWYAMFAIEAMAMGRPTFCYLRADLLKLYEYSGLLKENENPLINADCFNIKSVILDFYRNYSEHKAIAEKSRSYVEKHHSLKAIGEKFDVINLKMGLKKRNK